MSRLKELTGMRFGRLVVLERAENRRGRTAWKCRCDCGNEKVVGLDALCVVSDVILKKAKVDSNALKGHIQSIIKPWQTLKTVVLITSKLSTGLTSIMARGK